MLPRWITDKKVREATADPTEGFTQEEVSSAALNEVFKHTGSGYCWTIAQCDSQVAIIAELRRKYADRQPARLRRALFDWLDFYERRTASERKGLVAKARVTELSRRLQGDS